MGKDINTMNATFNFWVNNRPNSRGTYDIFIRITQYRKHKLIKTGISIPGKESFNPKAKHQNWIRGRADNVTRLNAELERQLEELKKDYKTLSKEQKNPSKEALLMKYRGESTSDFLKYLNIIINRFEDSGSIRSAKRFRQLYNKLKAFEADVLPFDAITVTFLKDFKVYLSSLHPNTIYEHFKNIKTALNEAIKEGITDKNPFIHFHVKKIPTTKTRLTIEEIKRLENLTLKKDSLLQITRDCFLFSFYCGGIRSGDMITMRWKNIEGNRLKYVMMKTTRSTLKEHDIPLVNQAKNILQSYHYSNALKDSFIFPLLDDQASNYIDDNKKIKSGHEKKIYSLIASKNAMMNKNLKVLAKLAEIDKKVTFHISRHSYAQFAISRDMQPKELQAILNHDKLSTTEKYIEELNTQKIDQAHTKLFA